MRDDTALPMLFPWNENCLGPSHMSDAQGNVPANRRAVALGHDHERPHFVDGILNDHHDLSRAAAEEALQAAHRRIGSNDRERLKAEVRKVLSETAR